jgi:hypothetical protein
MIGGLYRRPACCHPLVLLTLLWCALPATDAWTAYNISTAANGGGLAEDLDADGRIDVLSASYFNNMIVWYKNEGGSPLTWTAYTITTAAMGANSVFAADLDADGRIDVLSASALDNKVAWYKNGGGSPLTWTAYTITTAVNYVASVFAADLDGDGRIDVLSASRNDNKVAWYKNDGGSLLTWTAYNITTSAVYAISVFAVDLDADGKIDVLSAADHGDKVAWYKNGGGSPLTWTAYTITTSVNGPLSVFAADLDADGRIDVLSASYLDDKVAWYKNRGGSPLTWTTYTITSAADSVHSVFAADLDADGRIDVLSASANDKKVAWYKNGGGTPVTWTAYTITTATRNAQSVFAADLDADGRIDVLFGSSTDKVAWYRNLGCLPGFYVVSGACQSCPTGLFSISGLTFACTVCAAGRFGATTAMNTSACSGNCTAGYGCPAGSTNATVSVCPAGQFSVFGASTCSMCAAGRFGATDVMNTSACSGACSAGYACPAGSTNATVSTCPAGQFSNSGASTCSMCAAGRFGATDVMNTSACSGVCTAGYACPAGSTNATVSTCPAGQFSNSGASTCSMCAAGRFGATNVMNTSACSGVCTAGYACPAGSTNATVSVCPAGQYSMSGAGSCTMCAAGRFGALPLMADASCTAACPAGTFGSTSGLSTPACSGNCTAGYACPAGSITPAVCLPGQYSAAGTGACSDCAAGRYGNTTGLTTEACTAACAAGFFGGAAGLTTSSCSGSCRAGYACAAGSTNSTASICPAGTFSLTGSSACTGCAAGRFGATSGVSVAACSGNCTAGFACPAGSTSPTALVCPNGQCRCANASTVQSFHARVSGVNTHCRAGFPRS